MYILFILSSKFKLSMSVCFEHLTPKSNSLTVHTNLANKSNSDSNLWSEYTLHTNKSHSLFLLLLYFVGIFRGVCKHIDHFPDDADYEQDAAEYLLRE